MTARRSNARADARAEITTVRAPVSLWLGLLITAVVLAVLPLPSWTVDQVYSRNVYATLQSGLTTFSNVFPLALLDVMILGAVLLFLRRVLRLLGGVRKAGVIAIVWEGVCRLVRAGSLLAIIFLLFWGFNYRRVPLEEALKISATRPTVSDLQVAIADANTLAQRSRPLPETKRRESYEAIARDLVGPFNLALKRIGEPALIAPGRPKSSLFLTPFFTWSGVTGMVNPFALESIVHPDLLPFERPFVLAHEWAHLAGHADEAEASAVGWLACMQGDRAFGYSASLYLIEEAGAALPPDRWRESYKLLDPGVQADLEAIRKRMEGVRPAVQRVSSRVYDQYLKANRVDDGVKSYSRALSLILGQPFRDAMATYTIRSQ
jgi:hypothetical protein